MEPEVHRFLPTVIFTLQRNMACSERNVASLSHQYSSELGLPVALPCWYGQYFWVVKPGNDSKAGVQPDEIGLKFSVASDSN